MIETRRLRKTYKGRRGAVEAVKGIDLEVKAGEIFGFLGPNGAGKTTTLRMLATLLPPTAGGASVAGCDLRREPQRVRERIGYVGQQGGTDPQVSGRRELVFQGRLYRLGLAESRQRAAELISMLELEDCADRPTKSYSGGQRPRLDIGLGLIHPPPGLFLHVPPLRRPGRGLHAGHPPSPRRPRAAAADDRADPSEPRRRVPPTDRPLAPRRGRLTAKDPREEIRDADHPGQLAGVPALLRAL